LTRLAGVAAQLRAASRAAWQDARRNPALWVLFVVVPVVFIVTADAVTPDQPITLSISEHGRRVSGVFNMADVHGATMAPIAVASLAALVGLFAVLDSRDGDHRAALAGMRTGTLLGARLGVLATASVAATAVSMGATALVFDATRWTTYASANLLLAFSYALIGALLAPMFGRVGGVFLAFLLPFLDIGIMQSPMLNPEPTTLTRLLPGYGGSRVLLDGALTAGFDETTPLLTGFGWLAALTVTVALVYRASTRGYTNGCGQSGSHGPSSGAPARINAVASVASVPIRVRHSDAGAVSRVTRCSTVRP
jgi:hypothetical protein